MGQASTEAEKQLSEQGDVPTPPQEPHREDREPGLDTGPGEGGEDDEEYGAGSDQDARMEAALLGEEMAQGKEQPSFGDS